MLLGFYVTENNTKESKSVLEEISDVVFTDQFSLHFYSLPQSK